MDRANNQNLANTPTSSTSKPPSIVERIRRFFSKHSNHVPNIKSSDYDNYRRKTIGKK